MKVIDLTQPLAVGAPHMPSQPPYAMTRLRDIGTDVTTVSYLRMTTHTGTHIDAPIHMVRGGALLHEFDLGNFVGPVVPLTASVGPGTAIALDDLVGIDLVQPGDMVFFHTGWGSRFMSADYYDHPYLGPDVADWLVRADCPIVGIDTLGPDLPFGRRPRPFNYPIHRRLLGAGTLIIENLADVHLLGGRRHDCVVAPLRLEDVDGSPCRVLALPEGTFPSHGAGDARDSQVTIRLDELPQVR